MKKFAAKGVSALSLTAVAAVFLFLTGIGTAADTSKEAKHEKKLNIEISMIDMDAKLPYGEEVVTERLTKAFDVKSDRIKTLRDKNLGYGEVATVLAFADKMSGGVTDDNINRIMKLRQGNTGWGQIAKNLKIDLENVADKVGNVETDAHKDIKKAAVDRPAAGRGAGGSDEMSGAGGMSKDEGAGGVQDQKGKDTKGFGY